MNLRYNRFFNNNYDINISNTVFYSYWEFGSPDGRYKGNSFGLYFWKISRDVTNLPLGIKIEY